MRIPALRRPIFSALLLALCLFAAPFGAQGQGTTFNPALPLTHVDNGPNSAWAQSQHYLVLVSLDGFRWDYAARDNATHLLAIGKAGVWAPQGMLPSYPSLTFPNHYTLVTGLYPEHHGIVANNFLDPARNARYSMYDKQATNDGSWYGGVPLWSLAEGQGMRTACLLWVACEAKIAGFLPSYYATYDGKTQATPQAEQARIDKMKADAESVTRVTKANGEASARIALARASAAEGQAESASITPMQVEMHAYDALGKMGGSGTSIMLGDWSKLPAWLFPKTPGFQSAFSPVYALPPPTITTVRRGRRLVLA